jgi:prepilin-type N-terminal cleavage/methylation domain-containing protein
MIKAMQKGFTLIELLVVITIIGILATGAVTTFTSQIQKARDTTRISDVKALQGGVDKGASFSGVQVYVQTLPSDPKSDQASANSVFDYMYNSGPDANNIPLQQYELSTHFEQQGNIDKKAADDNGDDPFRLEV